MKNAHLIHVLPLGWSPDDSGAESDNNNRSDKRASSSSSSSSSSSLLSPSILAAAGPSRSAGYTIITKTPITTRDRTGGIFIGSSSSKPKLVQSIEQFLLSFAYPLGSLVSGRFDHGSGLNSSRSSGGAGLLSPSPSSKLKQRPKSALIRSSSNSKEHEAFSRSLTTGTTSSPSTSTSTAATSNFNNNMPIKPVPYLLAPGIFASCASRSNVRSRSTVPEDDFDDLDTRGDATHNMDSEMTALTIGEIILLGALDFDHTRPGTGPGNGRAWIGDVGDVVVVVGGGGGGGGGSGGSPDPGFLSPTKVVGIGKGKGREVNSEMTMKTTNRNFNGLLTPPESLSSNLSAESEEEEVEETYLDDHRNRNTRSKLSTKRTTSYSSSSSPVSTPLSATPVSTILKPKQTNDTNTNTLDDNNKNKVKDDDPSNGFSDSLPSPSGSPVQLPPLVVVCSPHGSRRRDSNSYDLGSGHEVQLPSVLPPMTVSSSILKAGSRSSASGSGMGSAMKILPPPLQTTQGNDGDCAYGKTGRSSSSRKKESERKGFVGSVLRKIGWLWNKR